MIDVVNCLKKAETIYGFDTYYKFSIQVEEDEAWIIGHQDMGYDPDWEDKMCKITDLI
jgi:hypothetical protein